MPINFLAFTSVYSGHARVLANEIGLSLPTPPGTSSTGPEITIKAIWDTGATCSLITHDLVIKLGLKPSGKTLLSGVDSQSVQDTYFVDVYLPNHVHLTGIKVAECNKIGGEHPMLIGMDIIGLGDLSLTHVNGITKMSFRIPSISGVDYVETAKNTQRNIVKKSEKQARKKLRKIQKASKRKNRKR